MRHHRALILCSSRILRASPDVGQTGAPRPARRAYPMVTAPVTATSSAASPSARVSAPRAVQVCALYGDRQHEEAVRQDQVSSSPFVAGTTPMLRPPRACYAIAAPDAPPSAAMAIPPVARSGATISLDEFD